MKGVVLPRDAGVHSVDYEWWYAHGYLHNEAGHQLGFMFSFFKFDAATVKRFFPQFAWYPGRVLYELHLGLTDITAQAHHFDEYLFAPILGHTGAARKKINVYYGPNHLKQVEDRKFHLSMRHHRKNIHLHFFDLKGPLLHGTAGNLSFPKVGTTQYYSHPRLTVEGSMQNNGDKHVEFVSGSAWIDHQWGNFAPNQTFLFWTWAGIQLDDGTELMIYEVFLEDGKSRGVRATYFGPNGQRRTVTASWHPLRSWQSPKTKVMYPVDYALKIPGLKLDVTLNADVKDQEMHSSFFNYWEGSCSVVGTRAGKHITGKAFLELTGYDRLSKVALKRRLA